MKLLRFLLFPFAILYDLITSVRNFLFDVQILSSTSFKTPVIIVGNLNVGGTGKTPQIEYLIRLLKDKKKVAVLSRGYKRKTSGFLLLDRTHTATDAGDEPLQYFKKFSKIQVVVDENRVHGINKLLKNNNSPELILLDDAFQHRKVNPGFSILLTKYNDLFSDDFLLPTGNLRESRRGVKRANVVIVTKCPKKLRESEQQKIRKRLHPKENQQVFFTTISYVEKLQGFNDLTLSELKEYEVLLITGIANPTPLLQFLNTKSIKYSHLEFTDHHHFSKNEIAKIQLTYKKMASPKKLIVTTEKDFVRLSNKIKELSYLEIKTIFLESQHEKFDRLITDFVKC